MSVDNESALSMTSLVAISCVPVLDFDLYSLELLRLVLHRM